MKDEKIEYVFYFRYNLFIKSKIYILVLYLYLEKVFLSLDYLILLIFYKIELLSFLFRIIM